MNVLPPQDDLAELARAAAAGDRAAAQRVIEGIRDRVHDFAMRMLGHPADAEDAAQEVCIIVLTHLGSFRGESAFTTWVLSIAANHLMRMRRGRRETVTLELLDERLRTGLREPLDEKLSPESHALVGELRLRCTHAMLLGLDREHRVAYVLADIVNLSNDEAAQVLGLSSAAFRKRLSRARQRLHSFLNGWCGVYDAENPCRCSKQVECALERGLMQRDDLYLSSQRSRAGKETLARAASETGELMRVAEVMRAPSSYLAPAGLVTEMRALIESKRLELLRD
jgi:RNA polymerase sigma factor (sigma-70 family)